MTTSHHLLRAQKIAESIVGRVHWTGAQAYCDCPGQDLHTTPTKETDCKVVCEPVALDSGTLAPGFYCRHSHCSGPIDKASYQLRRALWEKLPRNSARVKNYGLNKATAEASQSRKAKPKFDPLALARVAGKIAGVDEAWFAARSKVPVGIQTPATFLPALYKPGEIVLVFDEYKSQGQAAWAHQWPPVPPPDLDRFRTGRPCGVWFLCNPVTGGYAINDNGQLSRRSWQNVTSWRYMVLESDEANAGQWMAALAQLPLPIAAVSTSAGKSIHALVRIDASSKPDWDAKADGIESVVIPLGADPSAISAVRLTRLPCCERLGTKDKDGKYVPYPQPRLQRLLYLNPSPDGTPICGQEVLR